MNFYPLMLAATLLIALVGVWENDLMGYPILVGFGFSVTMVLRHYSALWVIGLEEPGGTTIEGRSAGAILTSGTTLSPKTAGSLFGSVPSTCR